MAYTGERRRRKRPRVTISRSEFTTVTIVALITMSVLFFVVAGVMVGRVPVTNNYDYGGDDTTNTLYEDLLFTNVIYINPNVSGGDGETWETAFDTIMDAEDAADDGANDLTLFVLSVGTHDVNYENPATTKNIAMIGAGDLTRATSKIVNTHADTDYIFDFQGKTMIKNVGFAVSGSDSDGLHISGSGSTMLNSYINTLYSTGSNVALTLNDADEVVIEEFVIIGSPTYSIGISFIDIDSFLMKDTDIIYCTTGIIIDEDSTSVGITTTDIRNCGVGLQVADTVAFCTITDVRFSTNTVHIANSSLVTFTNVHTDTEVIETFPTTPEDTNTITGGTGASVYGVWTELIANVTYSKHFQVVGGFASGASVETVFKMQVSYVNGGSRVVFAEVLFTGTNEFSFITGSIESPILAKITSVELRISTAAGTDDTVQVWLYIVQY
jgi:hypothetical protein